MGGDSWDDRRGSRYRGSSGGGRYLEWFHAVIRGGGGGIGRGCGMCEDGEIGDDMSDVK